VLSIANSASVDILGAPMMINAVVNGANQLGYILSKNTNDSVTVQYGVYYSPTVVSMSLEGSARQSTATSSIPTDTQKIYTGTFENGIEQGYVNGASSGTSGNYNGALTSRANMQIGARATSPYANYFKGYLSEIILLRSTQGRTRIEQNQLKYFGSK
jgi:hypothetical protein